MRPRWLAPTEVQIASALRDAMIAEAELYAPCETGGVLLGTSSVGRRLVVTELVQAGPCAERGRYRFVPDGPWQRQRIAERYQAAGRTLEYLGDWHSHPHGNGPSSLDRSTAHTIAATRSARCPHPLFVIATRVGRDWDLRAYRYGRRRFRPLALVAAAADP